ncbi:MAG: PVC-type heme-binding CxxCH protein [Isosphaeraceae bacterium]
MRNALLTGLAVALCGLSLGTAPPDDESLIFTPPGFTKPGRPANASGPGTSKLAITVVDAETGKPTPCRLNVVGPDGQFYQPAEDRLSLYSLTGEWPKTGKGNRQGKAPVRYFGRFFYTTGSVELAVPAGKVRVEAWKGFEFTPTTVEVDVKAGSPAETTVTLRRSVDLRSLGYHSGDPHLHFRRASAEDDAVVFDLLEAEDIRYGTPLGYNEPAGPYTGVREKLDYPQLLGLGTASERKRGEVRIVSGQEYRSSTYGHLNLFLRDNLVREGESLDANRWPAFGLVGRETKRKGGFAFHAHGGYALSIYADAVQGDVDAVELLQFGVYRGIELADWYRFLNIGLKFPAVGASDFPACRKLGDCVTYVDLSGEKSQDMRAWLRGASLGRSFVTTGPLLLLEVDGKGPGSALKDDAPGTTHKVRVRVASPTSPVQTVEIVVNGKVVQTREVPAGSGRDAWFEISAELPVGRPSWVAAHAFGKAATGSPDAEAHTNPVYISVNNRAPFDRDSLDRLVEKLDGQMNAHRARNFPEKARVLDYFQKSRDILLKTREAGGLPADGVPKEWLSDDAAEAFNPAEKVHTDAELAAFLKPLPPRTPAEAIRSFETAGPFEIQPVAAEPTVRSPVTAAFDENGNLYVCEMTDYPFKPRPGGTPLGSVRLLRDVDGNGRFDESHVFAEGLLWAAGVAPWKGGVFVASPPDIWYLKDTDGDHRADLKKKVYTGFGTGNEQGMLNNLVFGLDHKFYGSTSVNGGTVRPADKPDAPAVAVNGHDFRFDPVSGAFEAITGTVQFGTTFDDFGNRFLCSESRPLLHAVLPLDALARNPYLPVSSAMEDVAGHPVPIFRISPLERWRQIRSSRRIAYGERSANSAGASHHVIDAAAGVTAYRGSAYGPDYAGNLFVCDAQNNLVHRMKLTANGPTFKAARADAGAEFLRSYDNWFRPVNLLNAPDGTLYVLDMSREIIEAIHIPLDVMKHLDLRRGRDQGRIYRIAPKGFQVKPSPRLGSADTTALVAALDHPDGWWRDTAHRLIFERQDRAAVEPLRRLLASSSRPATRVVALWSLRGLDSLEEKDLLKGLKDPSPEVVAQAVQLASEHLGSSPKVLASVLELAASTQPRVRFAVALALGATTDARAVGSLERILMPERNDRWTTLAALSSSAGCADRLMAVLLDNPKVVASAGGLSVLETLAGVVGTRNRPEEVRRVLSALGESRRDVGPARRLTLGLGEGLKRAGGRLDPAVLSAGTSRTFLLAIVSASRTSALDPETPIGARVESVRLLSCFPYAAAGGVLSQLLAADQPGALQAAALSAARGLPRDRGRLRRAGPVPRPLAPGQG